MYNDSASGLDVCSNATTLGEFNAAVPSLEAWGNARGGQATWRIEDAALPCFRLEWHGVQSDDGCPYTDASQLASQLFVLQGKGGGMDPACPCAVCSAWRAAGRPRFQAGRLEAPSVDGEDLRHAVSGFGGALAMDCFTRVAQP